MTKLEFIGLLVSILVAGLLLSNTLQKSVEVLRSDIGKLETRVTAIENRVTGLEVKVAGIESKLDLLIDAWNIDVPDSPSVAQNKQ